MKKRLIALLITVVAVASIASCGQKETKDGKNETSTAVEASVDESLTSGETVEETVNTSEETASTEETTEVTLESKEESVSSLADGVYTVQFDTDSSMFHVNEACDGKATLTVEEGQMTVHLVMPSKNVKNLFLGLAEDAQKEGAELIEPTVEEVTYEDGLTEEVFAFDVPVPVIGEEFDLALIGKKEVWYDHKVSVSNPELLGE